jgi:hypothetical protein
MGRYERILPLPIRQAMLENQRTQEDPKLSIYQKQIAAQQYQALVRQQDRYNRLIESITNSDETYASIRRRKDKEEEKKDDPFKPKPEKKQT